MFGYLCYHLLMRSCVRTWSCTACVLLTIPMCFWIASDVVVAVSVNCSMDSILGCLVTVINDTRPVRGLPFGDNASMQELCTMKLSILKDCHSNLTSTCTENDLKTITTVNNTLDYLCQNETRTELSIYGSCIRDVLHGDRIQSCDYISTYESAVTSLAVYDSIRCSHVTPLLNCIRWVTWSFCGERPSRLIHQVYKLALNNVIKLKKCTLLGDDEPAGLAASYVQSGQYLAGFIITSPQPKLYRIVGDPKKWLPQHIKTGSRSLGVYIGASSTRIIFGHLAADYWHNKLLWVERGGSTVNEMPLYFRGSVSSKVIFGALSRRVSAIAVDWVTENVYVADAGYKWIAQISYKAGFLGNHRILIDTNVSSPSGVVAHPRIGRIFWSDKTLGRIESALISGVGRYVVISLINAPEALCLDYSENRLYWIQDGGYAVASCFVDGANYTKVISRSTKNKKFIDIEIYEEYLFLTVDKKDLEIYNKTSGEMLHTVKYLTDSRRTLLSTYGVTIAAPDKQYPYDNPCFFNNGGCEQLCILDYESPEGRTCRCSIGYNLLEDGTSCGNEPFQDEFLLVADEYGHNIYMVDINTERVQAVPVRQNGNPVAIAFDHVSSSVFWIDESSPSSLVLWKTLLNGSSNEKIQEFRGETFMEIAYDFYTEYLYCTTSSRGQIVRIFTGSGTRKTDVIAKSAKPMDIVLDISTQSLFWSDWDMFKAGIYKANMKVNSAKKKIVSSAYGTPTGLAIDTKARRLYFTDLYAGKVEVVNLDGSGRSTVIQQSGKRFRSIALDDQYLYVADTKDRSLKRYNRQSKAIDTFGPPVFEHPVCLRLYHSSIETYIHTSTEKPTTTANPLTTTITITTTTTPTTTTAEITTSQNHRSITTEQPATTSQSATTSRLQETSLVQTTEVTTQSSRSLTPKATPLGTSSPEIEFSSSDASTGMYSTAEEYRIATDTENTVKATNVLTTTTTSEEIQKPSETSTTTKTTKMTTTTATTTTTTSAATTTTITTTTTPVATSYGVESTMSSIPASLGRQSVKIEKSTGNKTSVNKSGLLAGLIVLGVLIVVALAGFIWYKQTVGPVHVFQSAIVRFSPGDDTVTLTRADTPVSTMDVSRDPARGSLSDLYYRHSGDTEC